MNIGPLEIIIVIVVLLLLFGARRLPELGRGVGEGIRGFGKGVSGDSDDEEKPSKPREVEASLPQDPPTPQPDTAASERPAEKPPGAER
jgi:sec-independent protein translocase protein TatA